MKNFRAGARPRLRCSDQTLACAVSLVNAELGWVCLDRVAALTGLDAASVKQRLPGALYLLTGADREAALSRLGEDELDAACGEGYEGPLPAQATSAPAGSAEKIAVLAARFEARQQLHHPEDARLLDDISDRVEGEEDRDVVRGRRARQHRRRGRLARSCRLGITLHR